MAGRHALQNPNPFPVKRVVGTAVLATTGSLAIPAGLAQAATTDQWNTVAKCESTNNWSINTGNGYYGGLQFSASTWAAFGGKKFASQANLATKSQQITIAERVLASQGKGAWPVCGKGLTNAKDPITDLGPTSPKPSQRTSTALPKPQVKSQPTSNPGRYDVVSGDTLWHISARNGISLNTLIGLNPQIKNPNLIFAGDRINLPGGVTVEVKPQSAPTKSKSVPTTTQKPQVRVKVEDTSFSQSSSASVKALSVARSALGTRYRWGGNNLESGVDCSGLVQQSFRAVGISLPRTADAQMRVGRTISRSELRPGDLVFATNSSGHAYHVAIYIGGGDVIEAPKPGTSVHIRGMYPSLNVFRRIG